MYFILFLGLITILFILHYSIKYQRVTRILEAIPGPKGYPIIGNLFKFKVTNEKRFELINKMDKEYYPIYKLRYFFNFIVILLHPEDVEVLMRSNKHITKNYKFLKPWLSNGLITSDGAKWQHRRKILTPGFHFNILKHFVITLHEEGKYLVSSVKEQGMGKPIIINLEELMTEHTLNALCETAMGSSLRGNGEEELKYRKASFEILDVLVNRSFRPWYYIDTIFSLSSQGRLQEELLKTLHGFTNRIIAERKRFHEETKGKYLKTFQSMDENDSFFEGYNDNNKYQTPKKRLAMLDLLIAASWNGNQIDDEGIREEVDTFLFAERIRDEVNSVMNEEDYQMTISVLNEFSYLERCIKESLRLYPSVHFISRYITDDMQLKNYLIPAGTNVQVNIINLHRNPEFWPNPDVFDPDRFLPENINERNPFCYIPFSAGLRNCIGQKFAMHEMKITIAHILHNFYLEPFDEMDEMKLTDNVILRPEKPLHVKFVPIQS
ncbi:hypothetical protein M0802_015037 [Mischocyttarus mexicanus]|nr:hypothetical protein M0802_015037 [Mischocyttarus mexicanus]